MPIRLHSDTNEALNSRVFHPQSLIALTKYLRGQFDNKTTLKQVRGLVETFDVGFQESLNHLGDFFNVEFHSDHHQFFMFWAVWLEVIHRNLPPEMLNNDDLTLNEIHNWMLGANLELPITQIDKNKLIFKALNNIWTY
jgi:hypothetical protein